MIENFSNIYGDINDYITVTEDSINYYGCGSAEEYYGTTNKYTMYMDAFLRQVQKDYIFEDNQILEQTAFEAERKIYSMDDLVEYIEVYENPFSDRYGIGVFNTNGVKQIEDNCESSMEFYDLYNYCKYIRQYDHFIINDHKFGRIMTFGISVYRNFEYLEDDGHFYIESDYVRCFVFEEFIRTHQKTNTEGGNPCKFESLAFNMSEYGEYSEGHILDSSGGKFFTTSNSFISFNASPAPRISGLNRDMNSLHQIITPAQIRQVDNCKPQVAPDCVQGWFLQVREMYPNSPLTNISWVYNKGDDFIKFCVVLEHLTFEIRTWKQPLSDFKEVMEIFY